MTKDLVRFTVDATTALAFGEDPNTIEESGNVIQEHLAEIFPDDHEAHQCTNAIVAILQITK
jgi:hypothetical protein